MIKLKITVATVRNDNRREISPDSFRHPAVTTIGCNRIITGGR